LLAGLDDVLSGRGRLFLIGGEPGIGKSRLADELAAQARSRGATVLWGRCWEAGGAPAYWPWVQCLRSYLRTHDEATVRDHMGAGAADIAQMLPEVEALVPDLPPPASVDPESARFRLFDSTVTLLRNAGDAEVLVIVIDDLHAADTASLLLLRFLAGQLGETRVLLLATYRDVELTPDHPLTASIPELVREPTTHHLLLRGLEKPDVARLLHDAAEVTLPPALLSEVHRRTNGNPLFVGETITLLAAEGGFTPDAEAAPPRFTIPGAVRDVILRRLGHLSEPCRRALTLASVLGTEVAIEALRQLGDMSADEFPGIEDEAAASGLLVGLPGSPGRVRFSHGLVREALYEEVPPARRARLHLRAGELLERMYSGRTDPHIAEIAHHFFEGASAGEPGKAVDYATRAGDRAAGSLAYEEAARLYRMALQALEVAHSEDEEARGDLLLALGDAQARSGDLSSARETFLRASDIARRTGAAHQLGRAALGYGGRFVWARAGDDPHLVPLLQDALDLLGGSDDRMQVRLLTRLACALRDSPDREQSASLSKQAVELARTLDDPASLAYALDGRIWATWWPENPQERLEIAVEFLRLAEETREGELIVDGHVAIWAALTELGDMGAARAEAEALSRAADELRQPAQRWVGNATRIMMQQLEGDFGAAEGLIQEALEARQSTPVRDNLSAARFQMFLLRREQGRVGETEAMVRESAREFFWYPVHRIALVSLLLEVGRVGEARVAFEELARDGFRALPRDNYWLLGTSLAAEACSMLGDEEAAAVLYEQLLPFQGRPAIGPAEGTVGALDRYLGLLAVTLGRPEDAERHFEEAIQVNGRMGARPWTAHSQCDYARMLLSRGGPGDRERAEGLLSEALATCRTLGMAALERKVTELLGESPPSARAPAGPAERCVFRREGEYWSVAFEGKAFRLRDLKGLRYLARLLAEPGREFHVLDLVATERGAAPATTRAEPGLGAPGDTGEVLDAKARAAYRDRVAALEEDIEEARSFGDAERAARAEKERDFLVGELAGAVGLGGRPRRAGSEVERARVSVTQAIRTALRRIREQSSALGAHLDRTVLTGTFCSYVPDPRAPVDWRT